MEHLNENEELYRAWIGTKNQDEYIKNVKKVDGETLDEIIRLYEEQRSNINPHKELLKIDKNDKIMRLKDYFQGRSATDVLYQYFKILAAMKNSSNVFKEALVVQQPKSCVSNPCVMPHKNSNIQTQNVFSYVTPSNIIISGFSISCILV